MRLIFFLLLPISLIAQEPERPPRVQLTPENITRGLFDIAPQIQQDLMPHYREVPDHLNAAPIIENYHNALTQCAEMKRAFAKYRKTKKWNHEFWEEAFAENQPAKELLTSALQKPYLQPEKPINFESSINEVLHARSASDFIQQQLHHALNQNDIEAALIHLQESWRLAELMVHSDSSLIGWLVATALYNVNFTSINTIIDHPAATSTHLLKIEQLLNSHDQKKVLARYQEAIRYEHYSFINTLNDLHLNKIGKNQLLGGGPNNNVNKISEFFDRLALKLLFQPNRSFKLHASFTRHWMKSAETPAWERSQIKQPEDVAQLLQNPAKRLYFSSNAIGMVMLKLALPMFGRTTNKIDDHKTTRRLLHLKLALRQHHLTHGKLPQTLADLKLPQKTPWLIDPYSGKQLHYDAEKLRIWGIGKDLLNQGGLDEKKFLSFSFKMSEEPTYFLDFSRR